MKKILKISLMLVALLAITTTAKAATAEDFLAYISKSQTIAGKSVTLVSAEQKRQIEVFIKNANVSETDLDTLEKKYDEAVNVMKEAGVTDYKKLSSEDTAKITAIANEASAETGISYNVKNGAVDLKKDDTTVTLTEKTKQTGSSNYIYLAPVVAIVAVTIALVSKKRIANAR